MSGVTKLVSLLSVLCSSFALIAQKPVPSKPRILISTDIGGTDPDDNQSMIHFLMYSNMFKTEGLISSPSYGHGTKQHILDMIALYEKDLPKLKKHGKGFPLPDSLRAICKQGRQGAAPFPGFTTVTEGSDWIVRCARQKSREPLWVLVWGGLDDLAQALHDAPDIRHKIKIYWIGGPNKKWSANSYAYIVEHFPDLWFIEVNSSYYGFFSKDGMHDSVSTTDYYERHMAGAGNMGEDFKKYYGGSIKMGDTPSLLYMLDGNPNNPLKESWGGSFEKLYYSPRRILNLDIPRNDTVTVCSVLELQIKGPRIDVPVDSACFTLSVKAGIGEQKWAGFYRGDGNYVVRYVPKQAETITYAITSAVAGFPERSGQLVVNNEWPGKPGKTNYPLGKNWYTDRRDPQLYDGKIQGGVTVKKWRNEVLLDWAKRWAWLRN